MRNTVYPKKYAHGFVVLCFVVVMQSFIMNSHEVSIHIHQGCFAGTGAIVRLPQCQWSKPDGYGKISQCITTTKHSKAKTVCIFLGIYCTLLPFSRQRYQDNCCFQDGDAMCHLARIVTTLLQQEGIAKMGQPKKSSDWHTNDIWNHYRVTGLSPVTGEFPIQMASNAENVSVWWRHHATPKQSCTKECHQSTACEQSV